MHTRAEADTMKQIVIVNTALELSSGVWNVRSGSKARARTLAEHVRDGGKRRHKLIGSFVP